MGKGNLSTIFNKLFIKRHSITFPRLRATCDTLWSTTSNTIRTITLGVVEHASLALPFDHYSQSCVHSSKQYKGDLKLFFSEGPFYYPSTLQPYLLLTADQTF